MSKYKDFLKDVSVGLTDILDKRIQQEYPEEYMLTRLKNLVEEIDEEVGWKKINK